jgi:hypothetical protein
MRFSTLGGAFASSAFDSAAFDTGRFDGAPGGPADAGSASQPSSGRNRGTEMFDQAVREAFDRQLYEDAIGDRSEVTVAVRANAIVVILSVAPLVALVDEKLASLREERPNEPSAQDARDQRSRGMNN